MGGQIGVWDFLFLSFVVLRCINGHLRGLRRTHPMFKVRFYHPLREKVSFNVVIPSLPSFTFSSSPPQKWSLQNTARAFKPLMTGFGIPDLRCIWHRSGLCNRVHTVLKLHDVAEGTVIEEPSLLPVTRDQLAADGITLDTFGERVYEIYGHALPTGTGYFVEENTEVCI